jgi:predicted O-methyltransferase YrrM
MKISKVLNKFKNTTTLEKLNNFILPNIKNIKNLNILEFGVDKGISTAFFLNLINNNKGNLTSVDIKNYKDLYSHKNWTFIHSKDDNYKNIERFIKKKFDIIFLDTEHTAQHIKKIFYYYYPKLK